MFRTLYLFSITNETRKDMKYFLVVFLLIGCSTTPYVRVDVGRTVNEFDIYFDDRGIDKSEAYKWTCNFEAGLKYKYYDFTVIGGVRHNSRCLINWPFNDKDEYSKDELFIGFEREF